MKSLLKLIISLLFLLLALSGMEKLYTFGLLHNKNSKAAYVSSGTLSEDLLFHGPCEPLWMIDPDVVDTITGLHSYNLALSHSDFADNYLHLYLYLKHQAAPRYLFLYVTPESMDEQFNTFNTYRFAAFLGDAVVDSVVSECDPGYYRWSSWPFMRYAYYNRQINFSVLQGWKHWLSGRNVPYYPSGYEPPKQVKWDNHLEAFNALYPKGYRFQWSNRREKYLRKLIVLAKKHGVSVYLYESPVLKEALQYQPNRVETIERIQQLAKEEGVEYVQFTDLKMAESRDCFMSTLNTNLKGSAIVNDTLAHFIKNHLLTH